MFDLHETNERLDRLITAVETLVRLQTLALEAQSGPSKPRKDAP